MRNTLGRNKAHAKTGEVLEQLSSMATVVGLGTGIQSSSAEAHGRPRFTEVDLRRMLEHATGNRRDAVAGRWIIQTRHSRRAWDVIVEPLTTEQLLLVVTAYPLENEKKVR
jgi:hypothetical protein